MRSVLPEIRYAKSGEVNIAYRVLGDGPLDLVLVHGFISHLELDWEEPRMARFLERLASFSRLILFDKRGTGLSDRPGGLPDLETRMDDVRAVMDAVGSEQAALFGYSEGGPMSCLFAATHPERTSALVLYGTYAKRRDPDEDYPWAATWEERQAYAAEMERDWGTEADLGTMIPNADAATRRWWAARTRASASPGAARDLILMNSQIDIRPVLPAISAPTLVLHRHGDRDSRPEEGRYIAERIPGARFVELAGDVHHPMVDSDQILDEVEEFLTGRRPAAEPDRVLATVLFTDIVGSTERAASLGDRRWRELIDRHDALVRHELQRFQGREVDSTGDGFLATFDGPARAIRCADSLRRAVRELGLEIRAGLHTGECEVFGDAIRGIAVHTGARVAALAGAGEVLVSNTVKDLVAGSGIEFADRGTHELKGVPGEWRLYAVSAA
ncbi:MAG TPA: adenylate/guanylate cyclase domain-containing protein [Gaiellaceae bacterium]|nr:adenylate/guanylate cyclase domain-containing protein [Gaiellaceae bacterium]